MLKKDKNGRFRRMTTKASQKWLNENKRTKEYARDHKDTVIEHVPSLGAQLGAFNRRTREIVAAQAPLDPEGPFTALKRIVSNLSDSYELADVLVELRDKLQRIADEAQPLSRYMSNPSEMPIMKDARRAGVISCLGEAIRNARQMETWRPKVDTYGTVGALPRFVERDEEPAEDPVPTPKRLRKDDVMLPCCDRIVRPKKRGARDVACHGSTYGITRTKVTKIK